MTMLTKAIAAVGTAAVLGLMTGCSGGDTAVPTTAASSTVAAMDTLSPAHQVAVCGKVRDGAAVLQGGPQLQPGWTFERDQLAISSRLDRLALVQRMLRPTLDTGGPAARSADRWLDSLTTEADHLRAKQLVAGDADAIAITWASTDAVCKRYGA